MKNLLGILLITSLMIGVVKAEETKINPDNFSYLDLSKKEDTKKDSVTKPTITQQCIINNKQFVVCPKTN